MVWHSPLRAIQRLEDSRDLQHDRPSFWIVHPLSAVQGVFKHIFKGCQEKETSTLLVFQQHVLQVWDASATRKSNTYSLSKAAGKQPLETVRIHHTVTICSPASPHWVLHAVTLSSLLSIKFTTGRGRLNTQSGLQSILHNLSDTGLKSQIFAKVYRQNFSITEQFCTQCNKALQIDIPQDKQRCLSPSLGVGLFWVCTVASSSH